MYRLPEDKKTQIIAALKANPHAKQVAGQIGDVSVATVWKIAKAAGIELIAGNAAKGRRGPDKGSRIPAETHTKIIAALKANPNARQVTKQVGGVSYATVLGIAKAEGIEFSASKLPAGKREQIIDALKANPNARQIAQHVGGVSNVTVMNIAQAEGIGLAKAKIPRERRNAIIDTLKANPNVKEVAEHLKLHVATVRNIAKAAGIELTTAAKVRREKVIEALKENPNARQVAQQVGSGLLAVRRAAKAEGITLALNERKRWIAEKRDEIIAALEENPNARRVAEHIGNVSPATVYNIGKAAGIKFPPASNPNPPIAAEKRKEIIAALKVNSNAAQVARQVGGVHEHTVQKIAKAEGIELVAGKAAGGPRGPFGPRVQTEKRKEIIAALKANPNAAQVARQIGDVHQKTVRKIAKVAGIELPNKGNATSKLSEKEREEIIAALKVNPNSGQVSKQFRGVPSGTVWRIAKNAGIELTAGKAAKRNRSHSLSPEKREKREKIIAALKVNPNATEVAQQVGGVHRTTVGHIAKAVGIELSNPAKPTEKREEIIAALRLNPNVKEVARQVGGVHPTTVASIAKAEGVELTAGKAARRRALQRVVSSPRDPS